MTFQATYLGANGWLIEFEDLSILIDPWLTGKLEFSPGAWLIEGTLPEDIRIKKKIDLILLTQGLNDHAHPPTLELFGKNIPIIGSVSAEKVAKGLGFTSTQALKPREEIIKDNLLIKATAGAYIPQVENGYILKHRSSSLYIEPHGYIDNDIPDQKLDAVITPITNIGLPFGIEFIKGRTSLPILIGKFRPKIVLASTTGGNIKFTGILSKIIKLNDEWIKEEQILKDKIRLICPIKMKPYTI